MTQLFVGIPGLQLGLPVLHGTLLEFGRRLTEEGVLENPEDVFHLPVRRARTHRRGMATTTTASNTR